MPSTQPLYLTQLKKTFFCLKVSEGEVRLEQQQAERQVSRAFEPALYSSYS
jgi:hypothetical protein